MSCTWVRQILICEGAVWGATGCQVTEVTSVTCRVWYCVLRMSNESCAIFALVVTRIILRPLSALSLDEDLNSPCDKNASAAL